jgi:prepilin-type N-terminal cleavage/methylation domain-containing protein
MKFQNYKAFSLIELSIVILIIGILVAGVTQSSRLINAMRIQSLRSITLSSPVSSTNGLVMWFETVLENSFDVNETTNGSGITTWFDINPQSTVKNNATQTTVGRKPIYNSNGAVPLLNFNGVNSGQFFSIADNAFPGGDSPYTIFMVFRLAQDASVKNHDVLVAGRWTNAITLIRADNTSGFKFTHFTGGAGSTVYWPQTGNLPINSLGLYTASYRNLPSNRIITSHINGALVNTVAVADPRTTISNFTMIGGNSWVDFEYFRGDIGEIIIFNRFLNSDERIDIEKYLAKKWSIKLS